MEKFHLIQLPNYPECYDAGNNGEQIRAGYFKFVFLRVLEQYMIIIFRNALKDIDNN